jgi:hypothetical protein
MKMKNYTQKNWYALTIISKGWNKMMQKSTAFTTIFRVKKFHFHYEMQKLNYGDLCAEISKISQKFLKILHISTRVK